MALSPFQTEEWGAIWPATVNQNLELGPLIELINRRFTGKPFPPSMPSSASRSIWNDISVRDTDLPSLIRLLNRRLSGVRIPMTEDALTVVSAPSAASPIENVILATRIGYGFFDVGLGAIFQSGTLGNAWQSTIKRYARTCSGGYVRINDQIDPRSIIDPRYGLPDAKYRVRDCVAVRFPAGATIGANSFKSRAFWGISGMPNALSSSFADAAPYPFPFIGFRMHYDVALGVRTNDHVWRCTVIGDGLTKLHETLLAVDVQQPNELEIQFDGATSKVTWLINNAVVDIYTFATNTAPGQVNPYPNGFGTAPGSWNLVTASANDATAGFQQIAYFQMSPATPLVSVEYAT